MARRAPFWAIMVVTVALLAGCGGREPYPDGPTASVPTVPPTTANPYAVPDVVDIAYVNRVLAGLDQLVGDVTRLVIASRAITPEVAERVKAIYIAEPSNPESRAQRKIESLEDGIRRDFPDTKASPGNAVTTVVEIIAATPSCIFAMVNQDYSAASTKPSPPPLTHWVGLVPLDPANDPNHYNPTAWVFAVNGLMPDRSQPGNPCAPGS